MKNRIRELRKARGLTMKELGEVIGVAECTISQYETGKREPGNEILLRLGEYFNVSVGYILGAEDVPINGGGQGIPESGEMDDNALKFALWGDTSDIDDADLEDVKRYAAFVQERKRNKRP